MTREYSWRLAIAALTIFVVLLLLTMCADAHENYPPECCHDQHCHPVPCNEIRLDGRYLRWDKYSIDKDKARSDRPGCHVCIYYNDMICIWWGAGS